MGVDIDALIIEVRKRPPLYDTSNKEYHCRRLKKQLWDEVCCNLRTPEAWNSMNMKHKMKFEKEVLKKWNSLRTCFRRELRVNTFQNESILEKKKRKYIYFDDLLFLLPFTKVLPNESMLDNDHSDVSDLSDDDNSESKSLVTPTANVTKTYEEPMIPIATLIKSEVSCEVERNSELSEFSDGSSSINQTGSDFTHPNAKRKKVTTKVDDDYSQMIREDRHLLGNRKVSNLRDVDGDEAFLSSLLPSLKEFTTEEKLQLRIEILTTILNFKKSINRTKT